MGELFVIVISSMLVSNVVLSQFLGICPFLGVSKKVETAAGMGAAVTFVITIACIITYPVQKCILEPFGLEYLKSIAFILHSFIHDVQPQQSLSCFIKAFPFSFFLIRFPGQASIQSPHPTHFSSFIRMLINLTSRHQISVNNFYPAILIS